MITDLWKDKEEKEYKVLNKKKVIITIIIAILLIVLITLILIYNNVKEFRQWADVSIFNKEKREFNEKTIQLLNNKTKDNNIRDILKERVDQIGKGFRSRSRKKKEGDINE